MTRQPSTPAPTDAPAHTPADAAPPIDFVTDAADESISCPLCDYDLRGLIEPRCPECGYAFDWRDLRDPGRRVHRYLFEHHPEHNVRSFLRTMLGHLRPREFWGALLPSQPSSPRRLRMYALVILVSALMPPAAVMLYLATQPWGPYARETAVIPRLLFAQAAVMSWPVFSFTALMIFQISMRRARVRPMHFVRCVVYAADIILWANLLLAALVIGYGLREILIGGGGVQFPDQLEAYAVTASCMFGLALLVFSYRLVVALKKYLRFDHPIATLIAAQVIAFLALAVVLANL